MYRNNDLYVSGNTCTLNKGRTHLNRYVPTSQSFSPVQWDASTKNGSNQPPSLNNDLYVSGNICTLNKRRTHLIGTSLYRNPFRPFNGAYRDHLRIHSPSCNGGDKKGRPTCGLPFISFRFPPSCQSLRRWADRRYTGGRKVSGWG